MESCYAVLINNNSRKVVQARYFFGITFEDVNECAYKEYDELLATGNYTLKVTDKVNEEE